MTTHVMLDLETMGSNYKAAVISIGAVMFWPEGMLGQENTEFSRNIYLESAVNDAGLRIEAKTVTWWLQQSEAARQSLRTPIPVPLYEALEDFANWLPERALVWGYGSNFDNARLREAYEAIGLKCPFHYRDDRDVRTLLELAGEPEALRVERADKHSALADARFQAEVCARLLKGFTNGK